MVVSVLLVIPIPPHTHKRTSMAKGKKSKIEELKKSVNQTLDKKDMVKVKGGRRKRPFNGCGGIIPQ